MAQGIGNQITKSFTSRSLVQICPLFSSDQKLFPADGFSVAFVQCVSDLYPMPSENHCTGSLNSDPLSRNKRSAHALKGLVVYFPGDNFNK